MPAHALVVWRMMMVCSLLLLWPSIWRHLRYMTLRMILIYSGIGVIVALHWLTFYGSIKLSNASVAASCLALGSIFTSMIEPLLTKKPWDKKEFLVGLLALPGVVLLVGGVPISMRLGIAVGVLSALLTALFSVLNKRYVFAAEPSAVTLVELGVGGLFLLLLSVIFFDYTEFMHLPASRDLFLLLILAVACTLLPFVLSLFAMRHISAFEAQLALNLEPVYAIIIAAIWLGEKQELHSQFYLGVGLILIAVFIRPVFARIQRRQIAIAQSLSSKEVARQNTQEKTR